ncbi:tRNA (adenosine(37)-N6)-threonylcarbamoyltransferase complex ATPase subunit type 1 TsaE [Candidatus Falkowbacteria bacterium]|nr:tRNA (adenosine(37)-N6)-threonylcarbamoyltransferase complex ATPase subunit type 1 TsaE [Candidatus Falkowbacteria bacterium]
MKLITTSSKQTFNLAKKFSKKLKGGEIIGLIGELGAGKTVFVKGLAAGLGIKKNITSPTFMLMKIYSVKYRIPMKSGLFQGVNKIKNLIHVDAYRLRSAKDLTAIGVKEYFNRPDTIMVIEWANRIKKILPKKTIFVNIKNLENSKRLIKIWNN